MAKKEKRKKRTIVPIENPATKRGLNQVKKRTFGGMFGFLKGSSKYHN